MSKPIISLIFAMSENHVIGVDNGLPWHLPDDLKFFQKSTLGKPVIMGRKTFDSIGFPLPKRKNIILSREKRSIDQTFWVSSIDEALDLCDDDPEVMIMGGAQIYKLMLPYADRLYITQVHKTIEGDTKMPPLDLSEAALIFEEYHPKDERHQYDFTFQIWDLTNTHQ